MVSTLDSESSDLSSNLSGTLCKVLAPSRLSQHAYTWTALLLLLGHSCQAL